MKKYYFKKSIVFSSILLVFIVIINYFMQPIWIEWNNYDTTHGFYTEKENSIETIFLGSSVVVNGINPMKLYEEYGICSYNLGTEQQPVLASYYWLEECYRLHPNSMKTVVFDVSMLRHKPVEAFYHKAIDSMKFSSVKYSAVLDYSDDFNDMLSNLVPLFSYHSRWSELNSLDFFKYEYRANVYTRGFNLDSNKNSMYKYMVI